MFGGIEGGGTKFVGAVGTGPNDIRAKTRFPTTSPQETLGQAVAFFQQQEQKLGALAAIGVACFGPLDPRPGSPTYGYIMPTPKPGWTNADIVGPFQATFNIPIGLDTDVNGATLAEGRWGAAQGLDTFIYLTIGTGIGGGAVAGGKLLHGLLHPEMGHILLTQDREQDPFEGACPFHKDCFEGLAAGPAIEKRWGQRAETLASDHPAWDLEARYIALALANYIFSLSPQRIILSGVVAQQAHLMPRVRQQTLAALNGYVQMPALLSDIEHFIVTPGLGNRAGVMGALALAEQAYLEK